MPAISKWRAAVFAIAMSIATLAVHADESRYQSTFSRKATYKTGRIVIEHNFGSLVVTSDSSSEVSVRATVRASDPVFGEAIRISMTEGRDGGIVVRTSYPQGRRHSSTGDFSYSVDMRVEVPSRAPVTLKNRFGSIDAISLKGPMEIENAQGSVLVRDAGGPLTVTNAFGSVGVYSANGDATVTNQNGSIDVRDVKGNVSATNRFGSVQVISANNNVTVRNTNASVVVRDVKGNLEVDNGFANTVIVSVGGNTKVSSKNGPIELRDVKGSATVAHAFGGVVAASIGGSLTVTGQNVNVDARDIKGSANVTSGYGTIKLTEVKSSATVRSSFGPVFLHAIGGAIDVQNENGSISVRELNGGRCQPISLRSSFASMHLRLPSSPNYDVNARTTNGRINTQIPIRTTLTNDETIIGRFGNGGCRLDLANSFGSITIETD